VNSAQSSGPAPCSICGASRTRGLLVWNGLDINKCPSCGVLFVVNAPSQEELVRLYGDHDLVEDCPDPNLDAERWLPPWKMAEHAHLLDLLAKGGAGDGTLLDVGCFSGMFLRNAKLRGYEVTGVEPNKDAVSSIRNFYKFEIVHGHLHSGGFSSGRFSVVSFLDVIEHLRDPIGDLKESFRVLRPGGLLLLTTPNVKALLQQAVRTKRWFARQAWCPIDDVPWHLWGFAPDTLSVCAEKAGFAVKKIVWLDPSPLSTNLGAGATSAKKKALRAVSRVSKWIGQSDRFALIAQKPADRNGARA
jgi:SAM-dependent methyltransferase